jgi:hypothetical protein
VKRGQIFLVIFRERTFNMADDKSSNTSGGVNLSSGQTDIGGDVTGRDKVVSDSHTINTGGGAYFGGSVTVDHGGKLVGRDDHSVHIQAGTDLAQVFESIYRQIEQRPATPAEDQADLKAEVEEVQAEVAKGEEANVGFLEHRLRNLKRMAPDILEVMVNALGNPALGIATTIRKVLAKAKAPGDQTAEMLRPNG